MNCEPAPLTIPEPPAPSRGPLRIVLTRSLYRQLRSHSKIHCAECGTQIPEGRPGRRCKTCRELEGKSP